MIKRKKREGVFAETKELDSGLEDGESLLSWQETVRANTCAAQLKARYWTPCLPCICSFRVHIPSEETRVQVG